MTGEPRVAVLDTSAIVRAKIKQVIPVLAQAIEFRLRGRANVVVVTHEQLDTQHSMPAACARLGLVSCSLEEFMAEIGFRPDEGWLSPAGPR